MENESEDLAIKSDRGSTIVDVNIEAEDEEKPFLGFNDSEADIKPHVFYKDLLSSPFTKNLVPFISDLVENTTSASGDEVINLKNIKQELNIYEENSEEHISNFDDKVPDDSHKHITHQGDSFIKELVPVIKVENDDSDLGNNTTKNPSVKNRPLRQKNSLKSKNSKLPPWKNITRNRVIAKTSLESNTANTIKKEIVKRNNVESKSEKGRHSFIKHSGDHDSRTIQQDEENVRDKFSRVSKVNVRCRLSSHVDSESLDCNEQPMSDADLSNCLNKNCDTYENECDCVVKYQNKDLDEQFVCDSCGFETAEYKTFQIHQNTHKNRTTYACKHCEFRCTEKKHLQEHNEKHTDETQNNRHNFTSQSSSSNSFIPYKKEEPDSKPFSCQQCSFRTRQSRSLMRHIKTLHKRPPSIFCNQCDFKCYTQKKLNNHMIVHSGKSYFECTDCDYKHQVQAVVKRHMVIHKGRETLKCPFCCYRGVLPEYVQKHMEKHHNYVIGKSKDKNYLNTKNTTGNSTENGKTNDTSNSAENGKGNSTSNSTEKDSDTCINLGSKYLIIRLPRCDSKIKIKTHGNEVGLKELHDRKLREHEDDRSCITVDKELESDSEKNSTVGDLFLASDIYHQEEKSSSGTNKIIVSKQMDEKVSSAMDVGRKTRALLVTSGMKNKPAAKKNGKGVKVPLTDKVLKTQSSGSRLEDVKKCDVCNYSTASASEFETHLKKHNNHQTPFICDICEVSYGSKTSLNRHTKLKHSNRKPYKCKLCNFKGALSQYLKCHMLTHSSYKPYACDRCEFTCSTASNLKLHSFRHDGIKPYSCSFCDFRCDTKAYLKIHSFIHTGETKFICKICNFKSARKIYLIKHMKLTHKMYNLK